MKKLPEVLPIKKCEIVGYLKVPHKHMGSIGGVVSKYVTVINEKWGTEGCDMEVSLVPGDYDQFLSELNNITKGEFQFEVEGAGALSTEEEPAGKKGKKKAGGKRK